MRNLQHLKEARCGSMFVSIIYKNKTPPTTTTIIINPDYLVFSQQKSHVHSQK